MKKILFSILGTFMVSTMASAQYLNVKLDDGTYHSYKTSSKTEVSFGDKAGAEIMEPIQVVKLYKGDKVVAEYWYHEFDRIVYEEIPPTTGTAKRTDNIDVNWVQLWKGGPKFAEYNVGATSVTDYGGYYSWGGFKNVVGTKYPSYNEGSSTLSGETDTATKLWGENWRMPTQAELQGLFDNCDVQWINDYKGDGTNIKGAIFTGKQGTAFASNSVFLPAAGSCDGGGVGYQGHDGSYWSSTPDGSDYACFLYFSSGLRDVSGSLRYNGISVRAVLNENE